MKNLLIVEDDKGISTQLKWGLSKKYQVKIAGDRGEALQLFTQLNPRVVILDLGLPPKKNDITEGMACLKDILKIYSKTKVIVVTGNDERETALQAVGLGAYDFYQKPVDLDVLRVILQRAFNLVGLEQEYSELKKQVTDEDIFEGIIGCCQKMQDIFSLIKKVSSSDATILITGESGTGKELVARAVHRRSLRNKGPFVPINCGAIPENLIESELFGYERGAFTDAKNRKIGLVEKASGGTLFLDEIAEFPVHLQVKLLRFIEDHHIQRVGGTEEIEVDLRIIAASNKDLKKEVKNGSFREDLFFRISVIGCHLPPLKDRDDDLLILAKFFLNQFNQKNGKKFDGFTGEAISALMAYDWPGNVRELENKIQRAVILAEGLLLEPGDMRLSSADGSDKKDSVIPPKTLKEVKTRAEISAIKKVLLLQSGNISRAAETLAISRPTLYDLMNKYGLKT